MILDQLRDSGMVSADGAGDDIACFKWPAASDKIGDEWNWIAANPALGYTIHDDNISPLSK
jgi:hypothetical protein